MQVQRYYDAPRESGILDYAVNIYKDDKFFLCIRYEGWSGTAVHEEIPEIKKEYPASNGFRVEW